MTEERENYRLRVRSGGILRREVEVTMPGFVYTTAMQTEDGAGPVLEIGVAQLSTAFGYGPERVMFTDG